MHINEALDLRINDHLVINLSKAHFVGLCLMHVSPWLSIIVLLLLEYSPSNGTLFLAITLNLKWEF